MRTFHFEMHKTTDFHPNLLVSWELVTKGYQSEMRAFQFRKTLTMHGNSVVVMFFIMFITVTTVSLE